MSKKQALLYPIGGTGEAMTPQALEGLRRKIGQAHLIIGLNAWQGLGGRVGVFGGGMVSEYVVISRNFRG